MNRDAGVVVTGAASGIGRSVCQLLADRGRRVLALDLDEQGLDDLTQLAFPNTVEVRKIDVSDSRSVDQAMADSIDLFGRVDAVVAAAGIWTPGTVLDLTDSQWDRALAVNLTGTFNVARAATRHLLASGGGSFVAIASDVGVQGSQGCAAYVAAKHAVVGLTRSIALDFGPRGIRANAVCPGFVRTAMTETIFKDADPSLLAARQNEVPAGRFADPEEIASVVGSLIGTDFSFVNGATIVIDGGATAGYYTPRSDA